MTTDPAAGRTGDPTRPGRLGDPSMSLGTDPRADPRMTAVLTPLGLGEHAPGGAPPVGTPLDGLREFTGQVEVVLEGLFAALAGTAPPVRGVSHEERTIDGPITLHVHRPVGADGPLPCVYQVHGGSMVMLTTSGPIYRNWRDELAADGVLVVGVEYRNAAGVLGPHPFPAGLDDCAAGLRWVAAHRDELGVANIVVTGDSGGANLALALAHKAKREGWLDVISGVHAQAPYIHGDWATASAQLPSLVENDGYYLDRELFGPLAEVYDPGRRHATDPTCWPYHATDADLIGLPPHLITLDECDPVRDEGLVYHRRLVANGVASVGRINPGLCHGGEILFRDAMPEVYLGAVRELTGFARSVR